MKKTLLIIWLVIIATWTASIVVANPERLSDLNFWLMVFWVNILISLNLLVSAPILSKHQERNSSKMIGALPSINIIVFIVSFISGSLAFINYFADPSTSTVNFFYSYHLLIQILLFGSAAVICLLLVLSAQGAESGARGLPTREELVKEIKNFEITNKELIEGSTAKDSLNELLQFIEYKMPHPSSLDKDNFLLLCNEINNMGADLKDESSLISSINKALQKAQTL